MYLENNNKRNYYDVLIVGSGAAGLALALKLPANLQIAILSKNTLSESSTYYAQGGIAAPVAYTDSVKQHAQDTISAGAGLCNEETVQHVIESGRASIEWLMQQGVNFTGRTSKSKTHGLHLNQEGGHSQRRIVHVADTTGKTLHTTLLNQLMRKKNVTCLDNCMVVDLISKSNDGVSKKCIGAYIRRSKNATIETISAKCTVLATGGASKVYLYTSNPDSSSGDGIAMGWRAGCRVANMEFIQFHPTCLYHSSEKSFLISEAVRGEGAKLVLNDGNEFLHKFDSRGVLAPRDIVARAIDHEMKRLGLECVYLDVSHKKRKFILEHFPAIHSRCLHLGFDITHEPIPVVPAAHYTCGGLITNIHGQTDVENLYAIGEVACTGMHGANRVASNSLLECLVFADTASSHIKNKINTIKHSQDIPQWDESQVTQSTEDVLISHGWDELRRLMWDFVGIVRTTQRLERAQHRIKLLTCEVEEYYKEFKINNDLIELRNLILIADLIVKSALWRKESRGLHYMLEHPEQHHNYKRDTILIPEKFFSNNKKIKNLNH